MQYLILALTTVLGITISTLVTQSWGRGFITWLSIGLVYGVMQIGYIFIRKQKVKYIKIIGLLLGIRLLTGVITRTRLWSQDTHCRQTPDMIQGTATVDRIRKASESYLIQQGNYQRIHKTNEGLQPGQQVIVYAATQKLQTCITTYTHRDIGYRKLVTWFNGGDFDYDRWLVMKGIDGYIQGKTIVIIREEKYDNRIDFINFKNNILKTITTLFPSSRSAGWVAGTLIGSKELIYDDDYDLLINSGLVHLIVVSGGNLALIILILGFILRRIPLIPRYILIGLGLIIYVMIVGPDSSVLRALAMAIMTILGVLAGRKWSFGGMLSITTIILLWYNPLMIYDIGLRLSLGAVIGIYLTYHEVSRLTQQRDRKRYRQSIRQVLLVVSASIGAWLGTLPVLIWQFGSANLTSIIANSVTGIIASITTIVELVTIALSHIVSPTITKRGVRIVDQLVSLIYQIAKLTVERGVWIGTSNQSGFWIISGSIMIIFILLYRHTQKMRVEYLLEIKHS